MTEVTIVREQRDMTLVEWTDKQDVPQRHWVKSTWVTDRSGKTGKVSNPEQGYPYGVDFLNTLSPAVTPAVICRELRRRGLWTADDLQKNPNVLRGALQAAYSLDFAQVIAIAKNYERTTEE